MSLARRGLYLKEIQGAGLVLHIRLERVLRLLVRLIEQILRNRKMQPPSLVPDP